VYTEVAQKYMNVEIGNEAAQFQHQSKDVSEQNDPMLRALISSLLFSTFHLSQKTFQNVVKPRSRKVKKI
jgi:hypothetical protein